MSFQDMSDVVLQLQTLTIPIKESFSGSQFVSSVLFVTFYSLNCGGGGRAGYLKEHHFSHELAQMLRWSSEALPLVARWMATRNRVFAGVMPLLQAPLLGYSFSTRHKVCPVG